MKKAFFTLFAIFFALALYSQTDTTSETYKVSLSEAVEIAYKKNLNLTNAEIEIRKSKWKIWETTAIGLPQVNGQIQFQDFLEIPTQLMPNFMLPAVFGINQQYFGLRPIQQPNFDDDKIAVQFGSKYNTSVGITLTQLIFNGEYLVGLKASKMYKVLAEQNYEKAKIELKNAIEQAYILCLVADESERILDSNLLNINRLYKQTEALVNQGMADPTKADQVKILKLTLENQLNTIKRQKKLAYLMLKFQMGLELEDSLVLTDNLSSMVSASAVVKDLLTSFNPEDNIEYKLAETQKTLAFLDYQRSKAKFLPSITGIFNYNTKMMDDEFTVFDTAANWYNSSMIGITINIPIFGSGQKYALTKQKKLAYVQAENRQQLLEYQLNIQFEQAKSNYLNAYDKFLNAKENLQLSQKVYRNTEISFKNGTASSMDLTQAQNQLLEKEGAYYQAIMELLKAKFELEKLLNQ